MGVLRAGLRTVRRYHPALAAAVGTAAVAGLLGLLAAAPPTTSLPALAHTAGAPSIATACNRTDPTEQPELSGRPDSAGRPDWAGASLGRGYPASNREYVGYLECLIDRGGSYDFFRDQEPDFGYRTLAGMLWLQACQPTALGAAGRVPGPPPAPVAAVNRRDRGDHRPAGCARPAHTR